MIVVVFKVTCRPDAAEKLAATFEAVLAPSRALPGVLGFDIARSVDDPNTFIATEVFEDAAARERQEALPEVGAVLSLLPTVLAGPPEATQYEISASSSAM